MEGVGGSGFAVVSGPINSSANHAIENAPVASFVSIPRAAKFTVCRSPLAHCNLIRSEKKQYGKRSAGQINKDGLPREFEGSNQGDESQKGKRR